MTRWTHLLISTAFLLIGQRSHGQTDPSLPIDTLSSKKNQINIGINSFPFSIPYYYKTGGFMGQKDPFHSYNQSSSMWLYQITYKRGLKSKKKYQRNFRTGVDFYYEQSHGNYNSTYTMYTGIVRGGIEWNKLKPLRKWNLYYGFEGGFFYHKNIDNIPYYSAPFVDYSYGIGIAGLIGIEKIIYRNLSFSSEFSIAAVLGKYGSSSWWDSSHSFGAGAGRYRVFGMTINYNFVSNKK